MGKKKKAAIALAVLLLFSCSYWGYRVYFVRGPSAIEAAGTIEATSVELNVRNSGIIKTLSVKAGDMVNGGQLAAELQRSDLEAQRERDAMALERAEAQLADLTSGARSQEIIEAQANVNIARANLDKTAADLEKREALFKQGVVSQDELDRYRVTLELDKNRLQAAEARLGLVEAGSRPEAVAAARAEVERCRAVLKAADAVLEDLKVYAPISGTILTKNYEPGEYVQMGASIATLADLNDLWIKVFIPTDDLPAIKLGQKVYFTVSGESTAFEGQVIEIASKGEYTPKSIQTKKERANVVFGVKIKVDNQGGKLKPGMPADVIFQQEQE